MRIEIPYSYSPSLSYEASKLVPNGRIQLPGKTDFEVPEIGRDSAPVRLRTPGRGGKMTEWRAYRAGWLLPLSLGSLSFGPLPATIATETLAKMAGAGVVPAADRQAGLCVMVQGQAVQEGMSGAAMLAMVERHVPRNPGTGMNRAVIDSGNWKSAQSSAVLAWRAAGIVSVGGEAWQTVREPVFVLSPGGRAAVLPRSAEPCTHPGAKIFAIDDWESAAKWALETDGRRPDCPAEAVEEAPAPRM